MCTLANIAPFVLGKTRCNSRLIPYLPAPSAAPVHLRPRPPALRTGPSPAFFRQSRGFLGGGYFLCNIRGSGWAGCILHLSQFLAGTERSAQPIEERLLPRQQREGRREGQTNGNNDSDYCKCQGYASHGGVAVNHEGGGPFPKILVGLLIDLGVRQPRVIPP